MPQAIPRGLTREHVLLALADLGAGVAHPFGDPTGYELVHGGARYAPKAVIGLACRHFSGDVLPPDRFSGGEGPGQANYVLRRLGFTVVRKGEAVPEEKEPRRDWTEAEVAASVADYFDMLHKELLGEPINKTEHRERLKARLDGRSDGSVEYKHQNISAVLVGLALPYVAGYKPAANYQALLARGVGDYLAANPNFFDGLEDSALVDPPAAPAAPEDPTSLFEDPPEPITIPETGKPWVTRRPRRTDFVRRDAENRRLGRLGEEFVVELERARLRHEGRDDLAKRVDWVASTVGDGLGFDVLSFDEGTDEERLVEVKTTALGKYHPFYVTATEVRCSEDVPGKFVLYRVFDFSREARVYALHGSLQVTCLMTPTQYRANPA